MLPTIMPLQIVERIIDGTIDSRGSPLLSMMPQFKLQNNYNIVYKSKKLAKVVFSHATSKKVHCCSEKLVKSYKKVTGNIKQRSIPIKLLHSKLKLSTTSMWETDSKCF